MLITTSELTLLPAYGRDYKSAKLAKADFLAGKDFCLSSTRQYCSIRDFKPGIAVIIRYANQVKLTRVIIPTPTDKQS